MCGQRRGLGRAQTAQRLAQAIEAVALRRGHLRQTLQLACPGRKLVLRWRWVVGLTGPNFMQCVFQPS